MDALTFWGIYLGILFLLWLFFPAEMVIVTVVSLAVIVVIAISA